MTPVSLQRLTTSKLSSPVGYLQGYINLKGYKEFAAENRPDGWNTWVTSVSRPGRADPVGTEAQVYQVAAVELLKLPG